MELGGRRHRQRRRNRRHRADAGGIASLQPATRMAAIDHGDVVAPVHDHRRDPTSGLVGHREVVAATETIRSAFLAWLRPDRRTVVLGGCCT